MKGTEITAEKIKKAVCFLEKRRNHARAAGNREWEREFENAISVIRGLSLIKV